jgi:hypothetical protein
MLSPRAAWVQATRCCLMGRGFVGRYLDADAAGEAPSDCIRSGRVERQVDDLGASTLHHVSKTTAYSPPPERADRDIAGWLERMGSISPPL